MKRHCFLFSVCLNKGDDVMLLKEKCLRGNPLQVLNMLKHVFLLFAAIFQIFRFGSQHLSKFYFNSQKFCFFYFDITFENTLHINYFYFHMPLFFNLSLMNQTHQQSNTILHQQTHHYSHNSPPVATPKFFSRIFLKKHNFSQWRLQEFFSKCIIVQLFQ